MLIEKRREDLKRCVKESLPYLDIGGCVNCDTDKYVSIFIPTYFVPDYHGEDCVFIFSAHKKYKPHFNEDVSKPILRKYKMVVTQLEFYNRKTKKAFCTSNSIQACIRGLRADFSYNLTEFGGVTEDELYNLICNWGKNSIYS